MPLVTLVYIVSKLALHEQLETALRRAEADCPAGETWLVTVVEDANHLAPGLTVFRHSQSGSRKVSPVVSWTFREDARSGGRNVPLYWKPIPFGTMSDREWVEDAQHELRNLLRALRE